MPIEEPRSGSGPHPRGLEQILVRDRNALEHATRRGALRRHVGAARVLAGAAGRHRHVGVQRAIEPVDSPQVRVDHLDVRQVAATKARC
jgi:hypothetical protein